jgi:dTDP-4-dehydrorhamnose reductase
MKILIVGAKGMLGQELAGAFNNNELILWDREDLDIVNSAMVRERITELKPDLIINSAAYNLVDEAENNPIVAYEVNYEGPKNLARVAKDLDACLIHYGTDYVFDGARQTGYDEDHPTHPVSNYGRSKLAGEQAVRTIGGKYYIIRPSRIFGRPAASEGAKKSFVDVMRTLAETKTELTVVHEEMASPTYAPDLAQLTKYVFDQQLPFGLYHGANDGACTWHEFAQEIFRLLHKNINLIPVPTAHFPRPAQRPAFSQLLNTKLPKQRSWQEALKEYLNG